MTHADDLAEISALKSKLKQAQALVFQTILESDGDDNALIAKADVAAKFLVHERTLERWSTLDVGFPEYLNAPDGRVYFLREQIETFQNRLAEMVAEANATRMARGDKSVYPKLVSLYGKNVAMWLVKNSVGPRVRAEK